MVYDHLLQQDKEGMKGNLNAITYSRIDTPSDRHEAFTKVRSWPIAALCRSLEAGYKKTFQLWARNGPVNGRFRANADIQKLLIIVYYDMNSDSSIFDQLSFALRILSSLYLSNFCLMSRLNCKTRRSLMICHVSISTGKNTPLAIPYAQ